MVKLSRSVEVTVYSLEVIISRLSFLSLFCSCCFVWLLVVEAWKVQAYTLMLGTIIISSPYYKYYDNNLLDPSGRAPLVAKGPPTTVISRMRQELCTRSIMSDAWLVERPKRQQYNENITPAIDPKVQQTTKVKHNKMWDNVVDSAPMCIHFPRTKAAGARYCPVEGAP